jgi:colanic acid/amylovoran biosynthesis glycosyltransferase
MLTMVHNNRARIENGVFVVDRKFHLGMQRYARSVHAPILSIQPEGQPGAPIMDAVEVPCEQLGYSVMTLKTDKSMRPLGGEMDRLRDAIRRSRLVCGGSLGSAELAGRLGVPYIMVLEYDLQTEIFVATSQVKGLLRRGVRAVKCILRYARSIPIMHRAHELHCNGYPMFDQARWFNSRRLFYFDSRMSVDMVITEAQLRERFDSRAGRPLRLLYTGRYEPMKGADHAVRAALACLRRGMDVEMHCYGQGSLRDEMQRLAAQAPGGRIHVHDAVPFPELVALSRTFDVFVCCHLQSDPSATYLESFGSGLPIVGYGNRMWRRVREESDAGLCAPMRRYEAVADGLQKLIAEPRMLDEMSLRARRFALDHTFEITFSRRVDAINAALALSEPRPDGRGLPDHGLRHSPGGGED